MKVGNVGLLLGRYSLYLEDNTPSLWTTRDGVGKGGCKEAFLRKGRGRGGHMGKVELTILLVQGTLSLVCARPLSWSSLFPKLGSPGPLNQFAGALAFLPIQKEQSHFLMLSHHLESVHYSGTCTLPQYHLQTLKNTSIRNQALNTVLDLNQMVLRS